MVNTSPEFRPTIFLDTNALHYMSSYLPWAEKENLPPFHGGVTHEQAQNALRQHMPKSIADFLLHGAETLSFLQQEVNGQDAAIYTSRFAKAEVIYGVLEGQAHARLAREGLPYRMRQRAGVLSELVSMYLESPDYQRVVGEWDDFLNQLKNKGYITVSYVEDEENFSRIAEVAEFLQSRIFMDVVDSWMYACALVMQAERIITFDKYFKDVVNRLQNPQTDPDWKQLQSDLKKMLKEKFPGEPTLPKVERLPRTLPEPW